MSGDDPVLLRSWLLDRCCLRNCLPVYCVHHPLDVRLVLKIHPLGEHRRVSVNDEGVADEISGVSQRLVVVLNTDRAVSPNWYSVYRLYPYASFQQLYEITRPRS